MILRLMVIHEGTTAHVEWPERTPAEGEVRLAVDGLMLAVGAPLPTRTPAVYGNGYVPARVPDDWAPSHNPSESGI